MGQNPYNGVDPWRLFAIATWDGKMASNGKTTINIEIPILFTGVKPSSYFYKQWLDNIQSIYSGTFGSFNIVTTVNALNSPNDCEKKLNFLVKQRITHTYLRDPVTNRLITDVGNFKTIPKELPIAIEKSQIINNFEYKSEYIYNTVEIRDGEKCRVAAEAKGENPIKACSANVTSNQFSNDARFNLDTPGPTAAHEVGHMLGISFDPYFGEMGGNWKNWSNVMGSSSKYSNADWLMFSVILNSQALVWKDGKRPVIDAYNELQDLNEFALRAIYGNGTLPAVINQVDVERQKQIIIENVRQREKLLTENSNNGKSN